MLATVVTNFIYPITLVATDTAQDVKGTNKQSGLSHEKKNYSIPVTTI